ncbi:MAG TPA: hypothetical protein VFL10_09540 [Ornithinibacter sp.]|nr:hypothetical protein [Ornithinibacter sp.]
MTAPSTTGGSSVRRRIADARATIVGTKGLRARVNKHAATLSTLRTRLDEQKQRIARQDQRMKALEARVKDLNRATSLDLREGERRDSHVGALEVRLADLEQVLADSASGVTATRPDDDQLAAGRTLLDEVRTEHARIRARMQVVSAYEERLRRVEESVTELFDGDRRHLV